MSIRDYLSVDFEDWYQGLTSTSTQLDAWPDYPGCLESAASWMLDCFARHGVRATFFVVGEVAREHPELVARIATEGHELGLHGNRHQRCDRMSESEFRDDISANLDAVRGAAPGAEVAGFRAPCFSHPGEPWFYEVLAEHGLRYDSSVFPIRTPLYGRPQDERAPHRIDTAAGRIAELPMTTLRAGGVDFPFSGGFYFRALPYAVVRRAFERVHAQGRSVVFYCHPWEFAPGHGRPERLGLRERVTHYTGLDSARAKLERLLSDFNFVPMGEAPEAAA